MKFIQSLLSIQIVFCFLTAHLSVQAQTNGNQSTYSIRKSHIYHVKNEMFDSIPLEVKLNEKSQPINLLMVIEKELLLLFNNEFSKLVDTIMSNEIEFFLKRNHRTFLIGYRFDTTKYRKDEDYFEDPLNKAFFRHLQKNASTIKSNIDESYLSEKKKLFLYYYIDLMIYYIDRCSKQYENNVLESGAELVNKYPKSNYSHFARKYKRHAYSISDWGGHFNWPVVSVEIPLNESMYNTMSPLFNVPFLTYGLGGNYKNFMLEAEGGYAFAKENAVLTTDDRDSTYFINTFRYSLVAGYRFHLGDRFTLTPFIGRRNLYMAIKRADHNHNASKPEEDPNKYSQFKFSASSWYYGVSLEINSPQNNDYECGKRYSRFYQRLSLGISSLDVPFGQNHVNGNMLVFQYTIGIHNLNRKGMKRF